MITENSNLEALWIEGADAVVLVPAYDWSRISHGDAMQHGRVTFVGGRVCWTHLELGLHCTYTHIYPT